MVALVPNWMIYFTMYNGSKKFYSGVLNTEETAIVHVLSAMTAGATTNVITNPLWVLKTRFQTQTLPGREPIYTGILQAFKKIVRDEGVSTLYRGLGPSLIVTYSLYINTNYNKGLIHVGVQFPLYEGLKREFSALSHKSVDEITVVPLIFASAISKGILKYSKQNKVKGFH